MALRSGMPRAHVCPDGAVGNNRTVTVLVPAHNEEELIGQTLMSLRHQTQPADRVIVIADNCTDRTVEVALHQDVEVFETVANSEKKGGALNQVLSRLLCDLGHDDLVLVTDADSRIDDSFIEIAARTLESRPEVGAVGGVFFGDDEGGLVGALQRSEYVRYAREIARKQGRAVVLTGTASMFRAQVFAQVAKERGRLLPGRRGDVYDTEALTEDNEITLAIKTLGWLTVSPRECRVTTEVMTTWRDLWVQRLRWQRGALENLRRYGVTRVTAPYLAKQLAMYLGMVAVALFLVATVLAVSRWGLGLPQGIWLGVTLIFVVERIWTVRLAGWRAVALAAPLALEFAYDIFQQMVYLQAAIDVIFDRTAVWNRVDPIPEL
ncbi:MAG: glycosyltransferase [Acidimicrobiia bacterium]|nr:glycosyltransferase [Acidimicrobiia bacterium]